ncbi:helix-turn-helix domain-containing protein [Pokkaliibacter sp. MBI-7]|uniref:helix-turn-helix domain-containing protein n=1 Tax=Pokkaliibacter sp. MBI-7 TaxID=3040600 RepID=UPI00244D605A|nr:helix-turn-helix domain-containing protein [Pokkaliibacter sp. MBI-7]MDH2435385.1 helix-turn-helix domain-containing protein [Pokkaliibacter sp. MBI-7]MDH2435392.1 helix-turn-helix domain-containing protein [Pokkaliibacter sp. MBI-7]MDH2435399.1 helix-turn-helix domain-containing protein [Pokkaliibacter sp. MBI-7]
MVTVNSISYVTSPGYMTIIITGVHQEISVMRWFDSYIDELKERMKLDSDYQVAKMLNVSRQYITKVRNGQPMGAEKIIRLANALRRDPLELIATANAQKETNADVRAVWIKLAKEKGNKDDWREK